MKKNITGIILGGGKNIRMQGFPKGLIKYQNTPFIEVICNKLQHCCDQIIISSNTHDYDYLPYPSFKDVYDNKGPIGGIYSTMLQSKNEVNLILPCDMPFIDIEILKDMIKVSPFNMAVAPHTDRQKYFMPCIIKKNSLPLIEKLITENKLKLGGLLFDLNCQFIPWVKGQQEPLHTFNINSEEELKNIELYG